MHKRLYRLIKAFAKCKADEDAGSIDDNTTPPRPSYTRRFSRARNFLTGRIQVACVKCVERDMLITRLRTRRPMAVTN
jgi:hypothetical protein